MRAKRLLSLVMALSMLFSLFAPSIVWAAEEGGHDVSLVESGGKNPAKVKTYKVSIRVSPSKAKAKVYVYDRRDDGYYADAQASRSSFSIMPPVGLLGNGSSRAFVLGVIAALRASAVSLNLLSAVVITLTGTPPAKMTPGL